MEDRIVGAKKRIGLAQELAALNAIWSIAKWEGGLSLTKVLGRDPMVIDERFTRKPVEEEVIELTPVERWRQAYGLVSAAMPPLPDREQARLISQAQFPTGMLSAEELERAYAELDPANA